jgi:hypothetical protein
MATKGRKRRQARRAKRKEQKRLRNNGPDTAFYGGSERQQQRYQSEARKDLRKESRQADASISNFGNEVSRARELERGGQEDYESAKDQAAGSRDAYINTIGGIGAASGQAEGIRDAAYDTNQLTGTAENALAMRQAALAGSPTIGQATDNAIDAQTAANQQASQLASARLGQNMGRMNRSAVGAAGATGESGALAVQQALAQAGQGNAEALAEDSLNQRMADIEAARTFSDMRYGAGLAQREEDVTGANIGLDTRMSAAQVERANQMAVADANAAQRYNAALATTQATDSLRAGDLQNQDAMGGRQLNLLGARINAQGTKTGFQLGQEQSAQQNQQFIEGTAAGINQADNQRAYEAAMAKNPAQKAISTIFDPADLRGSGQKGVI